MSCPRETLKTLPEADLERALEPMSWKLIKDRIAHLDHCAFGGVSADATLIASLVVAVATLQTRRDAQMQTEESAHG